MGMRQLKTNFVNGELDPLLLGRSDTKAYFNAAEYMRNVIVLPQGGGRTRAGSRYLWTVPNIPDIDGGGISDVRLAEFQFSTEQAYLFVFHHKTLTIFRNGAVVATKITPWSSAQLKAKIDAEGNMQSSGITFTQSRDTMIVFHEDFQPRTIKRGATHADWTIANYTFKNVPQFDFGDVTYTNGVDEVQTLDFPNPGDQGNWQEGDTFKLILEDEETTNIEFTDPAAPLAARIQAALRKLPNTSDDGITVTFSGGTSADDAKFTITFGGEDGQRPWGSMSFDTVSTQQVPTISVVVTTDGVKPGEKVWSTLRGWPRCGLYFQGRLWMAGTRSLPNTVWASRSGDYNDFNAKKIDDDYGISATTDTDDVPAFIAMYAGRHLQLFSTSAEFYVPASESDAITPANIVLRRTTSRGCRPGLRVFEVDGATMFVQRRGKALRELIFADVELAYQANSLSLLSSHLMRDPVGLALRRSTSTEEADYLFMSNGDGTATVFCTLRSQEVNAMALWNTQGAWNDVAVVLDGVYFACRRVVAGVTRNFIEIMDDTMTVDCGVKAGAGATVSLPHLPGMTIEHLLDGFTQPPKAADGAGLLTLARPAESSIQAGLKYPEVLPALYPGLIWLIKTLPIEGDLQDGPMMGRKRRVVGLVARLYETTALTVNGNRLSFQTFGAHLLDQPVTPFTGLKKIGGLLGYDRAGGLAMGSDISKKATILALAWEVSV